MSARWLVILASLAGVLLAAAGLAQNAAPKAVRRPDLQGTWLNNTATPLERPRDFAERPFFTPDEARAFEKRYLLDRLRGATRYKDFELEAAAGDIDTYEPGRVLPNLRTSLIVDPPDGRIPALTPDAQRRQTARAQHLERHFAENPEDLPLTDRCLVVGNTAVPPLLPIFYNNVVQIVQTADYVTVVSEMIHEARIIPIARRSHLPATVAQWKGDSIGRWERETLVVDTTNFPANYSFRGSGPRLHEIERFALRDANTLSYQFTIDDPDSFVRSWTGESVMVRTDQRMYEYACHEANRSMENTLRGARFVDKSNPK